MPARGAPQNGAQLARVEGEFRFVRGPSASALYLAQEVSEDGLIDVRVAKPGEAWSARHERVIGSKASSRMGSGAGSGGKGRKLGALVCVDHILEVELDGLMG